MISLVISSLVAASPFALLTTCGKISILWRQRADLLDSACSISAIISVTLILIDLGLFEMILKSRLYTGSDMWIDLTESLNALFIKPACNEVQELR